MSKCPGCQSIYVCWNWVSPTPNHLKWSHECWACGNCFSTDTEVTDGIIYENLNTAESKSAVVVERESIICHKLKEFMLFDRLCGVVDEKLKWTRSENDWDQITCEQCLAMKPTNNDTPD